MNLVHRIAAVSLLAFTMFISACKLPSNRYGAPADSPRVAATSPLDTSWQPKWDVHPDETRKEKVALSPTLSFVDDGFRGSPALQSDSERKTEAKDRQAFVDSFRKASPCFGVTLKLKNPKDADFGVQIFHGIDGRTGRWQWVIYRMDTLGGNWTGESDGASVDGVVDSVCSAIGAAALNRGGDVD